jgi:photosystem II stability/assembly factor-like uncharacterized protein/RecA/RadA recombinase
MSGCVGTGWYKVQPHYDQTRTPSRYDFRLLNPNLIGMWKTADGAQLWAVGQGGAILHTRDSGQHWETQNSGTAEDLDAIFGSNDGAQLWAVGLGTILHTRDGGQHWEEQKSGTEFGLHSVFGGVDGMQLWAVGSNRIILHTRDGGRHWRAENGDGWNYDLYSAFSNSDGSKLWAVGEYGAILYTGDGGKHWSAQHSGTSQTICSIFGNNDGAQLWAVGDHGTILYTGDGGKHWSAQHSGTTRFLCSIFGSTDGAQLWAVGDDGTILYTRNGGQHWETQSAGTTDLLRTISGSSDGAQLWVVGHGGTILHTRDRGQHWDAQNSGTDHGFNSILGTRDGARLWVAGSEGTVLHTSDGGQHWEAQSSGTTSHLSSLSSSNDGAQLWAVGLGGVIVHTQDRGQHWARQRSGTTGDLYSISGSSDGLELWAVGPDDTILRTRDGGRHWLAQTSADDGRIYEFTSIFSSSDGSQGWAVGRSGAILYTRDGGRHWAKQHSGTIVELDSIFGSNDGLQLWVAGRSGTILHTRDGGQHWEAQSGSTTDDLQSIFGSSDGAQLWTVGTSGTILYTGDGGQHWETQCSGVSNSFSSIFCNSDGAQCWAVGTSGGAILHASKSAAPYISSVRLTPKIFGAELQIGIIDPRSTGEPLKLTVSGATTRGFKEGYELKKINSTPHPPASPNDPWRFTFNPADIDVDPGTNAHFRIQLEQGLYSANYDVNLPYDRYHWFKDHWLATLVILSVFAVTGTMTSLLLLRPLWILSLYRKLKIYSLVEQIEIPGIGKLLQFLLKFTILPWLVTHPRVLRAWVNATRTRAAAVWSSSTRTSSSMRARNTPLDIPYVPLPVEIKDVSSRLLNQPTAGDLERLLSGRRNVVQIVGPGGGGKTTLAKHIGALALSGGEPGAFKISRLPIWVDEDISDLFNVVKRKVNSWYESGEDIEEPFLKALLENGLLLIIIDRVSERTTATQDYLAKVHGSVRCNAMVMTTRLAIQMEVPEQRFVYPQALNSSTLLNFMTQIIKYCTGDSETTGEQPFSSLQSQLELGKRLGDLIVVKTAEEDETENIPMLPLLVVLFVSNAFAVAKNGKSMDGLPNSLPDVYADYLRRINPKVHGMENGISDELMLQTAKTLARLSLGDDYIPREFTHERARQSLKSEVSDIPAGIDPLRRLSDNGVLVSKAIGASTFLRFALDPVAEFLAAEAYFDQCAGEKARLRKLLTDSQRAHGFHNALLQTVQARRMLEAH